MKQQVKITQWFASLKKRLSERKVACALAIAALLGVGGVTYAQATGGVLAVTTNFSNTVIPNDAPFNVSTLNITIVNNDPSLVVNALNLTSHITPNTGLTFNMAGFTMSGAGCTGTPTPSLTAAGDVLISGGGVAANSQPCTISIPVSSTTAGNYTAQVTQGEPLAAGVTVPSTQSATLTVQDRNITGATASKSFNPANINWWETSQMTLRITNPNSYPMTNAHLEDNLPANMFVDSLVSNGCTGSTVSGAVIGSNTINITGASLAAGASCNVVVRVRTDLTTGSTSGQALTNTIAAGATCGTLNISGITQELCSTSATTAPLNIFAKPIQGLSKSFAPATVADNGTTTMTIQLFNDTGTDWSNVIIPDNFPSGMYLASGTPAAGTTCTGSTIGLTSGTVNSATPDTAISIGIPSLPSGQWCQIRLLVKGTAASTTTLTNTIAANVITQNGTPINNQAVGADLLVNTLPPCTDCFGATIGSPSKAFIWGMPNYALGYPSPQLHPGTLPGKFILAHITPRVIGHGQAMTATVDVEDDWSASSPYYSMASAAEAIAAGAPAGSTSAIWGSCTGWSLASGGAAGDQSFKVTGVTFNIASAPTSAGVTYACNLYALLKVEDTISGIPAAGVNQTNTATVTFDAATAQTNVATSTIYNLPPIYPVKWFAPLNSTAYFSSSDSPGTFYGGNTVWARIYVRNDAPIARTGIAFSDSLPVSSNGVQMTLAPGMSASDIQMHCYQNAASTPMPNITVTGNVVNISGLDLPAASYATNGGLSAYSICTFSIPVQVPANTPPGESFTNVINAGDITVTSDPQASNVQVASDTISTGVAPLAPDVGKSFSPDIVFQDRNGVVDPQGSNPIGELSTLTFTVRNPNSAAINSYTNVSFSDTFPVVGGNPAIVVAPTPNLTYSAGCTGTPTANAVAGAGMVSFSNMTVANNQTCTITVDVIGKVPGNHTNTIPVGAVTATILNGPTVTNSVVASANISVLNSYPAHALIKDVAKASAPATSIDTSEVLVDDVLRYTLTLRNTGAVPLNLSEVESITDKVPDYLTFVSAANGGVLVTDTVTWDLTGLSTVLPVGGTYTVTWDAQVIAPTVSASSYQIVNDGKTPAVSSCAARFGSSCVTTPPQATCTAPVDPLNLTTAEMNNTAICKPVVNPFIPVKYDISKDVFKTSDLTTSINNQAVVPTDALTYVITVKNTGTIPILASRDLLTVSDQLPAEVTYVAGSASPAITPDPTTNAIAWDLSTSSLSIPVGGEAKFRVDVTVNMGAVGPLKNIAKVKGVDTNEVSNPITPPTFTTKKDVFKSSAPSTSINGQTVNLGDELLYVVTVNNPGPAPVSMKDVVQSVTDVIPTGSTYVANSATPTATTIPGASVGWDFASSSDVIVAGDKRDFSFKVTVNNDASGTVINTAKVAGTDTNTTNNPITQPTADITKKVYRTTDASQTSINGQNVAAGDQLTYQVTISNAAQGNLSLKSIVKNITDALPNGLTFVSASDGGAASGQNVTWDFTTLSPDIVLTPGQSKSVTVNVTVDDDATGILKNVAKTGNGLTSNEVENPITPPKYALLKDVRKKGMTESHNGRDVIGGDELTYVLTLKNIGSGNLSLRNFVQQVSDVVPTGTVIASVGNGGVQNGNTLLWELSNDTQVLSVGQTREFTFDVRVNEDATQPITNVAKTTSTSSCPIDNATCQSNPPVAACTMPANPLSLSSAELADAQVCKPVVNNLILDTTLFLEKTVDRKEVELGDMVKYTIRVKNAGKARATAVKVSDTLPAGFRYIDNTSRLSDGTTLPEPEGAPGPNLTFSLGNIAAGAEVTFSYRVRVGVGAMQGDGINRAQACTTANKILCSNEGRAKVTVQGGVFTDKACLAGTAFADLNGNAVKDENETGVPGVRLYMEDGTHFITDTTGKYSYCGIEPRTHVLKVDKASLPRGSQLEITSNRNMGDANSLFLDVKNGELHRGDVAIKPLNEQFMKDVQNRIKGQGDQPAKGVTFEGVAQ